MRSDDNEQPFLIELAIEPKLNSDRERLLAALAQLTAEDPRFGVATDAESGQIILKGMGELHLDIKVDILKRTYKVDVNVGAPQVAYRETVTRRVESDYVHKKQFGGTGQFAGVTLVVEPNQRDIGNAFESKIAGDAIPPEYIPAVEKGVASVLSAGVIAGYPVVDVRVTLIDGKYHDADSSALAFEIAARAAFREALQKAKSVLLEPIVKVEVLTPGEYRAAVIRDLSLRRGHDISQQSRGTMDVVTAMVPLATMLGYANNLRSTSQGRATFTMRYDHYANAPLPDDDPPPAAAMRA
jgi:elongation factor G